MKIIVATDSPKLNIYFAIHFVQEGIEPFKANSLDEIINLAERKSIDTLLIDMDSKIYNNFVTLKELKENIKDFNIIVMTSKTGMDFFRKIHEAKIFGLISKIDDMETQLKNITVLTDDLKKRKNEKRKHIRVQPSPLKHNLFKLMIKGIEKEYTGQIKDISRGGVAITFSNPPAESILFKGKEVKMSVELGSIIFQSKGIIVLRLGMEATILFHELSDGNKRKIFEYILTRIDE